MDGIVNISTPQALSRAKLESQAQGNALAAKKRRNRYRKGIEYGSAEAFVCENNDLSAAAQLIVRHFGSDIYELYDLIIGTGCFELADHIAGQSNDVKNYIAMS